MPWHERMETKEMLREEFVKRVLAHEASKQELCRQFGISRPTGDKWLKRHAAGEPLTDYSRAPRERPSRVSPELERLIVRVRKENRDACAVKVHHILTRDYELAYIPCPRTIHNVLKRNGCISLEASQATVPYTRFEKLEPNEMWQMDFKGHFAMLDGQRCFPLTITDDHSRFLLACHAQVSETLAETQPAVTRVFQEYGLPRSILCDNGNPWSASQSMGFSRFEVWLMELGILTLHGRPGHPQTQGKQERFHRSFKKECLHNQVIADTRQAQRLFDQYQQYYNFQRPHMALGMHVPAARYIASHRPFPARISEWEYGTGYELRRIKSTGYITYGGWGLYFSEAFAGKTVAVRKSQDGRRLYLYFRQFMVGGIHLDRRVFLFRRAYLRDQDPRQDCDLDIP